MESRRIFREGGGGAYRQKGGLMGQREIFSKRSLLEREFVRKAWDLLERGGLLDRGAY